MLSTTKIKKVILTLRSGVFYSYFIIRFGEKKLLRTYQFASYDREKGNIPVCLTNCDFDIINNNVYNFTNNLRSNIIRSVKNNL
jgi:hypothetical protein